MNRDANEPTEQRVLVGPHTSSGYREWKSFYGAEVRQVPVILSDSEEHGRTRYYTLYSSLDGREPATRYSRPTPLPFTNDSMPVPSPVILSGANLYSSMVRKGRWWTCC
jgi:hypothetical protein